MSFQNNITTYLFGIILFLLLPNFCWGQEKVMSEQFFQQVVESLNVSYQDLNDQKKVHFPWIDEYQLRTESRDFKLEEQEYTFRLSPVTPGMRKAQKDLLTHLRMQPLIRENSFYEETLYASYQDWLSLYVAHETKALLQELQAVLNDKILLNQKYLGTYEVDFKELIRLEKDKNNLGIDIFEIELQEELIRQKYNYSNAQLDFSDMIRIGAISFRLGTETVTPSNSIASEFNYESLLVDKEIALERAEQRRFFDFAQFRYRGPHENELVERFSIGLGLAFPNSGNAKLKQAELRIKQEELAFEQKLDQQRLELDQALLIEDIQFQILAFNNFVSIKEKEAKNLDDIAKLITKREGFEPSLILDIKENELQAKLETINRKASIYRDYLKYLDASALLYALPFRNLFR